MFSRFFILFFFVLGGVAEAYIPPSQYLVERVAQNRKNLKTAWVKSRVYEVSDEKKGEILFEEVTVLDLESGVLRSRAYDLENREIYASEKELRALGTGSRRGPVASSVLFENQAAYLSSALLSIGVPILLEADLNSLPDEAARISAEKTHMKRWEQHVLWGIAVNPSDTSQGQFWVKKDAFVPMRLFFPAQNNQRIELMMDQYRYFKTFSYPQRIRFLNHNLTQFEVELVKAVGNPDIKKYQIPTQTGFTEQGNSISSSVQKRLIQYYQFLR